MSDQSDDEPKAQEATAASETPIATPEVKTEEKPKKPRSEKQLAASRKAIIKARDARLKKIAYSKTLAGIPTDPEDDDPLGVLEFMIKREVGKKPHGVMVEPVVGGATATYVEPAPQPKDEKKADPKLPKRRNNVKPPAAAQSKVSSDESGSDSDASASASDDQPPSPQPVAAKTKRKPNPKPVPVETPAPPNTQRAAGPTYVADHNWAGTGISTY